VCDNPCGWTIDGIMHDCRLIAVGGVVGENAWTQNSTQGRVCVYSKQCTAKGIIHGNRIVE
jgi:hypothetical protein